MRAEPKSTSLDEVAEIERTNGVFLRWPITKEKDGADEVLMGFIEFRTDGATLSWEAKSDEVFYCLEGRLLVEYEGNEGRHGSKVTKRNEVLFLPRGYRYSMRSNGGTAKGVFCRKA